jgi:hypothetical protein
MTVRNPSELQRLEEERVSILQTLYEGRSSPKGVLVDKGYKAGRDALLRELREIEGQLGIESVPYNSDAFRKEMERVLLEE